MQDESHLNMNSAQTNTKKYWYTHGSKWQNAGQHITAAEPHNSAETWNLSTVWSLCNYELPAVTVASEAEGEPMSESSPEVRVLWNFSRGPLARSPEMKTKELRQSLGFAKRCHIACNQGRQSNQSEVLNMAITSLLAGPLLLVAHLEDGLAVVLDVRL